MHKISLYSYMGIKIETPFERYLKQRALDRESREEERLRNIELESELLKLKSLEINNDKPYRR